MIGSKSQKNHLSLFSTKSRIRKNIYKNSRNTYRYYKKLNISGRFETQIPLHMFRVLSIQHAYGPTYSTAIIGSLFIWLSLLWVAANFIALPLVLFFASGNNFQLSGLYFAGPILASSYYFMIIMIPFLVLDSWITNNRYFYLYYLSLEFILCICNLLFFSRYLPQYYKIFTKPEEALFSIKSFSFIISICINSILLIIFFIALFYLGLTIFRSIRIRSSKAVLFGIIVKVLWNIRNYRENPNLANMNLIFVNIEALATCVQEDLSRMINPHDSFTSSWYRKDLYQVAMGIRLLKRKLLISGEDAINDVNERMIKYLEYTIHGRWDKFERPPDTINIPRFYGSRLKIALVSIFIAVLPIIILLIFQAKPSLSLNGAYLDTARSLSYFWILIVFLFNLDPLIGDQFSSLKILFDLFPFASRKGK